MDGFRAVIASPDDERSHASFKVSAGFVREALTVREVIVNKASVKIRIRAAGNTQILK